MRKTSKTMTNAEAARHFASLPADEPAMISIVSTDTATAMDEELEIITQDIVDQIDDPHDGLVGMAGVRQEY